MLGQLLREECFGNLGLTTGRLTVQETFGGIRWDASTVSLSNSHLHLLWLFAIKL